MAAISTLVAVGATAVGAISAGAAYSSQKSQAKYQRQAAEFQQKQANLQNARAKRDAVREARLAFGTATNTAANQGVSSSSASEGGLASIGAQVRDNVSFLDQYGFYSDQASKALGNANKAGATAAGYGALSGLAFSAANNSGSIAKIFGGK